MECKFNFFIFSTFLLFNITKRCETLKYYIANYLQIYVIKSIYVYTYMYVWVLICICKLIKLLWGNWIFLLLNLRRRKRRNRRMTRRRRYVCTYILYVLMSFWLIRDKAVKCAKKNARKLKKLKETKRKRKNLMQVYCLAYYHYYANLSNVFGII